jgi:hypothetical protein
MLMLTAELRGEQKISLLGYVAVEQDWIWMQLFVPV